MNKANERISVYGRKGQGKSPVVIDLKMTQTQKFVFITRAELESVLRQFGPIVEVVTRLSTQTRTGIRIQTKETIYQIPVPNTKMLVHVYSSIEEGKNISRSVGKDAIRIITLVPTPHGLKAVGKQKRTHRTAGWEKRLEKKIRESINNVPQYTTCPKCDCPLIIRKRKKDNQQFFGCTNYPACKYACDMDDQGKPVQGVPTTQTMKMGDKIITITRRCPSCDSSMEERNSERGTYHACTAWPTCRFVEKVAATPIPANESAKDAYDRRAKTGHPSCPDCRSEMVRRSGKYGDFWGCSTYPRCRGTRNM